MKSKISFPLFLSKFFILLARNPYWENTNLELYMNFLNNQQEKQTLIVLK